MRQMDSSRSCTNQNWATFKRKPWPTFFRPLPKEGTRKTILRSSYIATDNKLCPPRRCGKLLSPWSRAPQTDNRLPIPLSPAQIGSPSPCGVKTRQPSEKETGSCRFPFRTVQRGVQFVLKHLCCRKKTHCSPHPCKSNSHKPSATGSTEGCLSSVSQIIFYPR